LQDEIARLDASIAVLERVETLSDRARADLEAQRRRRAELAAAQLLFGAQPVLLVAAGLGAVRDLVGALGDLLSRDRLLVGLRRGHPAGGLLCGRAGLRHAASYPARTALHLESGWRESNPHHRLGRPTLYH
jgi:hypothetical protein